MHSAYLKFEGRGKTAIEDFRKEHDSLFGKIEAHITVVFPNRYISDAAIIGSIQRLKNLSKMAFELDSTVTYESNIGYLKILGGSEYLERIYNDISSLLDISSEYKYIPHITVVRDSDQRPTHLNTELTNYIITAFVVERILDDSMGKVVYYQGI